VLLVVVIGALVLRFTDVGLRVRAMVDSPAMMSLSGASPTVVSVGVWATSTFLAGVTGVLAGPIIGLSSPDYTLLMCSAFAAVIAGKLRNLPVVVIAALLIGIFISLVQGYLPNSSGLTNDIIASIPFIVAAVVLIYNTIRLGRVNESEGVGGALDRAIAPQVGPSVAKTRQGDLLLRRLSGTAGWRPSLVILAIVVVLTLVSSDYWVGLISFGIAYGVVFLSFTLVTGEGGMIWLCQASFAGVGAMTTAQLATNHGWPVTLAILAGGVVALPVGLLLGLLTIRLGDLYVALVTLMFGLLADNLVFSQNIFLQNGAGVSVNRPSYVHNSGQLALLSLVVFCVLGLVIVNLRRSTTGLALGAVRWSEPGAKTIGISVVRMKVIVSALAAAVAGIGGGLLAVNANAAIPANFATLTGVIWLAVLVTAGIRSNMAALIGGLMFSVIPGAVVLYLTGSWGQLPPILFGVGAIILATDPEGFVMQNAKGLMRLILRLFVPDKDEEPVVGLAQPSRPTTNGQAGNVSDGRVVR
jgi:branched-chain amino acid transport system permease protein